MLASIDRDTLGDNIIDYLFNLTYETYFLDFKKIIDIGNNSAFPKIIKDVFAFTNSGGGYIMLGVEEGNHSQKFIKTGLPPNFKLDQASLQEKINAYTYEPMVIDYIHFSRSVDGIQKEFTLIYIPASTQIMKPRKDGTYTINNKVVRAFKKDDIYTRRGTQSIVASKPEIKNIEKRMREQNYKLSLISGEPDIIKEILFGNIFRVKKLPKKVHIGTALCDSFDEDLEYLRSQYTDRKNFPLTHMHYENKIITLQNLEDSNNIHHKLVHPDQIKHEPIDNWLHDKDKKRIIVSLMHNEITQKAYQQKMHVFKRKIFYTTNLTSRTISWSPRFKNNSTKIVARKYVNTSLDHDTFCHVAIKFQIIRIRDKFYLNLNPTFIITTDGKNVSMGPKEGALITRLSYNNYNKQYLNNILFWVDILGNGNDIQILDDFIISTKPLKAQSYAGISWDIPPSEIRSIIQNYEYEERDDELEISDYDEL